MLLALQLPGPRCTHTNVPATDIAEEGKTLHTIADGICVSDNKIYNAILFLERLQHKEWRLRYRIQLLMGQTGLRKTTAHES